MSQNESSNVYSGGSATPDTQGLTKITRIHHLAQWKEQGKPWPMLTAYDFPTARRFHNAGIPVLLVGDSAANVVFGYDTTVAVSVDEMLTLVKAVVRGAPKSLVVGDLVFGSYEVSPQQAVETATRFMKEGGVQAVKLEGGERMVPQIEALVAAGIPVMAHIGFTPQSVNDLGGFRVQGRGDSAQQLKKDAHAVQQAGAFAVVMEMVPSDLAAEVTQALDIPTIGIGAGNQCDAQVLVWPDMVDWSGHKAPSFVKTYAHLGDQLEQAARDYAAEVRTRAFPDEQHSFSQ